MMGLFLILREIEMSERRIKSIYDSLFKPNVFKFSVKYNNKIVYGDQDDKGIILIMVCI